jgi:hypothetical protein
MDSRRLLAAAAIPTAVALAACSSTTNGAGSTGAPGGSTASCGSSATQTDAAGLSAVLQCASKAVKTAHIDLDINAAGEAIKGSGDEELDGGVLTGMDITESLPEDEGSLRLLVAGNKTYAMLPSSINSSINPSGKPWVVIRSDSTNSVIQQLSQSISQTQSSASIGATTAFVTAARSVANKGAENVDGVDTTHYAIDVDPTKLPADNPGKAAASQAGITSIPVDLYVDSQGRPVKVSENFSVQGQSVSVNIEVSNYDQPVHIVAPDPDQVASP